MTMPLRQFDDRHEAEEQADLAAKDTGSTYYVGELLNEDGSEATYVIGPYTTVEEWATTRDASIVYTAQPDPA